jgi:hypothetical protein
MHGIQNVCAQTHLKSSNLEKLLAELKAILGPGLAKNHGQGIQLLTLLKDLLSIYISA